MSITAAAVVVEQRVVNLESLGWAVVVLVVLLETMPQHQLVVEAVVLEPTTKVEVKVLAVS